MTPAAFFSNTLREEARRRGGTVHTFSRLTFTLYSSAYPSSPLGVLALRALKSKGFAASASATATWKAAAIANVARQANRDPVRRAFAASALVAPSAPRAAPLRWLSKQGSSVATEVAVWRRYLRSHWEGLEGLRDCLPGMPTARGVTPRAWVERSLARLEVASASRQLLSALLIAMQKPTAPGALQALRALPVILSGELLLPSKSVCLGLPQRELPYLRQELVSRSSRTVEIASAVLRAGTLVAIFVPLLSLAPLAYGALGSVGRRWWLSLLRTTLALGGPATAKWGQWASTRADIFAPDVRRELAKLQCDSPSHSLAFTKAQLEASFGIPADKLFLYLSEEPVASGSVAQVHRARLSAIGARGTGLPPGTEVAVKVRHPRVDRLLRQDFALMEALARLAAAASPRVGEMLTNTLAQFSGPLHDQLDLTHEAACLERFRINFRGDPRVRFPQPVVPLVAPAVLVETFEEGVGINRWVSGSKAAHARGGSDEQGEARATREPETPQEVFRDNLGRLGVDSLLKMVIGHNFVHADLHPGNILVRSSGTDAAPTLDGVVFLDAGMTASLSMRERDELLHFFDSISEGDGRSAASAVLQFADGSATNRFAGGRGIPSGQTCPNPAAFENDMETLFDSFPYRSEVLGVTAGEFMQETLELVRKHEVRVSGQVLTVIVTSCVLEGWAIGLSPGVSVLDHVKREMKSWKARSWWNGYGALTL